jgi:oxalate---CoA ligase
LHRGQRRPEEAVDGDVSKRTVHGWLRRHGARRPDAPALLAPGGEAIRYGDLLSYAEETARRLRAIGLRRGDRVAVVLPNGPAMAASFLATACVAVWAPLNPSYRESEFEFYLGDLQPKVVIAMPGSPALDVAERLGVPAVLRASEEDAFAELRALPAAGGACRALDQDEDAAPDDDVLVLHTSGTTSRPKLVPLTQANLCHSARGIAASLGLRADDRCLGVMPLFHIHGLVGGLLSSIVAGASIVCTAGYSATDFWRFLETFRPTWLTAVPTIHQALLGSAEGHREAARRTSLRFIRSCSAPLPDPVMQGLERTFGVPVLEAYGMTEAAHQVAINPPPPGSRKPGSVGVATGTEIAILDENGAPLPPGQAGEVAIRGPSVTRGYLTGAQEAAPRGERDWFRTGDIGMLDADGYLFLQGRIKEFINRGGAKISPREVEDALALHPAVAEAAAFAVPDGALGEEVGAAVVLRRGASATAAELRAFAGRRLAPFKLPRRLVVVPEIPKGPTGKLQRIGLAERLGLCAAPDRPEAGPSGLPRGPLQDLLRTMFQQTLRIERVGPDDDFFDLGGDSLSGAELALALERVVGVPLSVGALIEAPTVARLAALIVEGRAARRSLRVIAIEPGSGSRRPFFCVNAGAIFRDLARSLGPAQPFLSLYCPEPGKLPLPYRVEDLAAYHVETMRQVQPEGPYRLGGWCADGLLAYAMAQRLRAEGQEVELLALFDAPSPRAAPAGASDLPGAVTAEIAGHLATMREIGAGGMPGYLLDRLHSIPLRIASRAAASWYAASIRLGLPVPKPLRKIETAQRLALREYRPLPYPGRVVLFRRTRRLTGRWRESPTLGWADLVEGPLTVHEIAGDHGDMLREPHAARSGLLLRQHLAEFDDRGPRPEPCRPPLSADPGAAF